MAKRLVDGDAIWSSDKLQNVPEEFRAEYAWVLPLAEANGCCEYNPAIIFRDCYAYLRPGWSATKVEELFTALEQAKMVFRFKAKYEPTDKERTWCFFIGMESRLPAPSDRAKYKYNAKIVPVEDLAEFLEQDIATVSTRYRDVLATTSRNRIGDRLGIGVGSGVGKGKGSIYLSNELTNEQACGTTSPTENNLSLNGEAKTRSTDADTSFEEESDLSAEEIDFLNEDRPCMCNNPQCPTPGDCAHCFRWSLSVSLSIQLGFEEIPPTWMDDAIPLTDKFRTKEERQMLSALVMWAYGRPADDFWRNKTRNMKAFVTHVLKGSMLRQFNEAKLKPEFWITQYYMSPDEPPNGRCPFPHYINAVIKCPDEMEAQLRAMFPQNEDGALIIPGDDPDDIV